MMCTNNEKVMEMIICTELTFCLVQKQEVRQRENGRDELIDNRLSSVRGASFHNIKNWQSQTFEGSTLTMVFWD